jgi:hypothetical protein
MTTTINSGGWKDEPQKAPTIYDIRRESGNVLGSYQIVLKNSDCSIRS